MRALAVFATIATATALLRATQHAHAAGASASPHAMSDAAVAIRTFQFAPDTLRVKVATRVVWTNADDIEHTITSGTPDVRDGRFNGVLDKRGATYSAVLEKAAIW